MKVINKDDEIIKGIVEEIERKREERRQQHLTDIDEGHICSCCGNKVVDKLHHQYCPDAWDNGKAGIMIACLGKGEVKKE